MEWEDKRAAFSGHSNSRTVADLEVASLDYASRFDHQHQGDHAFLLPMAISCLSCGQGLPLAIQRLVAGRDEERLVGFIVCVDSTTRSMGMGQWDNNAVMGNISVVKLTLNTDYAAFALIILGIFRSNRDSPIRVSSFPPSR